jgi:hypothetical protein
VAFLPDLRIRDSLTNGHVVNARQGVLHSQHRANMRAILANLRQIGFQEVVIRFASSGRGDPWGWSAWDPQQYATSRDFVLSTMAAVEQERGTLPVVYDLDIEKGGVEQGQGRPYTRALWADYLAQYPAARAIGFSIAASGGGSITLGATRLQLLLDDLRAAGGVPGRIGLDVYGEEFATLREVVPVLRAAGMSHTPVLVTEAYYNDPAVATAVARARAEVGLNITYLLQWPLARGSPIPHFSMHYPPAFSAYRVP